MTAHRNLGFVAAMATLLASAPLSAIFERWTWLIQSAVVVAAVAAAAMVTRLLRVPLWGQVLGMLAGLLLALNWLFPAGSGLAAVVPTPATFTHFGELLTTSLEDMRSYGVKVPDTDPLLFIAVLGIGSVAVLVDVLAVGLRKPALAGLPMLAIYSVPVAIYVDSVPAVPFVVGATGYLWLLVTDHIDRVRRFGRRFTGEGRDVSVWEASPLAAAGRRLAVVGVAVAVALPLAVPGMSHGLLTQLSTGTGAGAGGDGQGGSPGRIDLFASLSGQLTQGQVTDFVKVTTNEESPFYLRYGVADDLRSDGFRVRSPSGRPVNQELPDPRGQVLPGVEQRQYRATIEVTRNLTMPLLPTYAEPIRTEELSGAWFYDRDLQVLFSNRENSRGKQYSFDYVRSTYTPQVLRQARPLPAENDLRRRYTVTPEVREVEELVTQLTQGARTDYDKVRAVYDHFSADNGFTYQLTTESGTSGEEIVDFLNNKVGFCQQYAAAMAWLVRAAGIPARVAFGFTNGSDRDGNTYTLTNRNLHAWTEVYFDRIGWVPFDATPTYGVQGWTRSEWAPDTDAPEPTAPEADAPVTPDDPAASAPVDTPGGVEEDVDQGFDPAGAAPAEESPRWPWWALAVLASFALLAVPALRRMLVRRHRGRPVVGPTVRADPASLDGPAEGDRPVLVEVDDDRARAHAHAAWEELMDTLVDYRVRVDLSETPRVTAERLAADALTGDESATSAVRLLGRAEERARYARSPLTGEPLPPALDTVRGVLAGRADRRTRVVAAVLPPSVLMRWRMGLAESSSRFMAGSGRLRSRLLRWNPRRLLAGRVGR
ncbi:DUF3488 and transglutaminase-like domain-containing protein [Micromonospora sp. NPDC000207]|uniref:transglutaminase family protein n=1 Tax=Micromonospora sp. NPDC000207 TaxID=3154246 RepID=UPI00331A6BBA